MESKNRNDSVKSRTNTCAMVKKIEHVLFYYAH